MVAVLVSPVRLTTNVKFVLPESPSVLLASKPAIEEPSNSLESERNGKPEIPAETDDGDPQDQGVDLGRYQGNVNLLILLKKASDGRTIQITPDQLSRQIKNIPGGSVVNSGMQGKEYFIAAHFATPISLHKVLAEVAEWEDFADQSDKVKEYQKRAWAKDKGVKDALRILVTL